MKKIDEKIINECIRLRQEERFSLSDISSSTGVSKGTLSVLLRPYPLSAEEHYERQSRGAATARSMRKTTIASEQRKLQPPSDIYKLSSVLNLSTVQKARIGETMVMYRLALLGIHSVISDLGSGPYDVIASHGGKICKIQVKTRFNETNKNIQVTLIRKKSQTLSYRYAETDFDFMVGYNVYADEVFILSSAAR